jgi:arylsulfatase A-like enzyme
MGYDRYRDVALSGMKRLGMVPEKTEPTLADQLPRGNGAAGANVVRAWRSLSDDQKELPGRLAEAYAGLCSYTDHQVGRLLSYLDGSGQLDKTIVVVCSANATAEDSPDGLARKNAFSADWTGDAGAISSNDDLPAAASYDHQYCAGWAWAFRTPFNVLRQHSHGGSVASPLIISWPREMKDVAGGVRDQYHHAVYVDGWKAIAGHCATAAPGEPARRAPGSCITWLPTGPSSTTWPPGTRRRPPNWLRCGKRQLAAMEP